ncbi:MAG: hypothetical protein AABX71_03335, partial [Nanoarchaeota archaeon]
MEKRVIILIILLFILNISLISAIVGECIPGENRCVNGQPATCQAVLVGEGRYADYILKWQYQPCEKGLVCAETKGYVEKGSESLNCIEDFWGGFRFSDCASQEELISGACGEKGVQPENNPDSRIKCDSRKLDGSPETISAGCVNPNFPRCGDDVDNDRDSEYKKVTRRFWFWEWEDIVAINHKDCNDKDCNHEYCNEMGTEKAVCIQVPYYLENYGFMGSVVKLIGKVISGNAAENEGQEEVYQGSRMINNPPGFVGDRGGKNIGVVYQGYDNEFKTEYKTEADKKGNIMTLTNLNQRGGESFVFKDEETILGGMTCLLGLEKKFNSCSSFTWKAEYGKTRGD